ncbi:hypothetical protein AMK59_4273 [Oryctes borbonicus]|uniref:RING-type E3 ubiquitin transferase n=1 Tax=Oryctes borbonicus TaxID=1629725 RepID=A0A0T6B6Y5_9SCAR|nr:hypothetical protein AMK59_4273 [Oryctes borbonicus]
MDYLGESIALAIDLAIFGACFNEYRKSKRAISMIQGAPYLEIDKNLKEILQTHPEKKLSYVSIRGNIKPVGNPIISANNPKITGVVQSLSIKEHVIQRSTTGFWSDQERTIQEVQNIMPFVLKSNSFEVEVLDPLAADVLDMDVISDHFNPNIPSVMDHIWGFFAGIKQKGVQTTERMLRTGTLVTGIGEIIISSDGQSIKLQPPSNGAPYYLTNMQTSSLIRKLDDNKKTYRLFCILFGTIGLVIGGLMIRRYWIDRQKRIEDERRKEQLEVNRRDRRSRVRDEDLPENQICVVCKVNPREIILLPCGHVCLCEDCCSDILNLCPVCRTFIEKRAAAYLA